VKPRIFGIETEYGLTAKATQVTFVRPATFTRWEEGQGRGDEAFFP